MVRYCIKRLLQSAVTVFIIMSIVFLLLRLMNIEAIFPEGAWMKMSWEAKVAVLQKLGMYGADGKPINAFVQLLNYYAKLFTGGGFGESTQMYIGSSVVSVIAEKLPVSMRISLTALGFSLPLGFILGIAMARYKNSFVDNIGMGYIVLIQSIPALVYYFVVQLYLTKWLGVSMIYRSGNIATHITPIICLMLGSIAGNALWVRRYMVDEFNKDYVKLAYAKGLSTKAVMYKHVLRNAFVPMAYTIPIAVLTILSGSLILERLFSIPGTGRLLTDAINKRDFNLVQTLVFLYASLGIMGVFLGDMLAVIVDPRISFTNEGGGR